MNNTNNLNRVVGISKKSFITIQDQFINFFQKKVLLKTTSANLFDHIAETQENK